MNNPHDRITLGLYTYLIARKLVTGAYGPDEVKTVSAPNEAEAIIMLAKWSPGVHIKKLLGISAVGAGGTS